MKLALTLLLVAVSFSLATAQTLKRPGAVGNATIDGYVDSSFDIYEEIAENKRQLNDIKRAVADAKAAGNGVISVADGQAILQKLEAINNNIVRLQKDLTRLTGEYSKMQSAAKSMPKLKIAKAVKAVDAANDANKSSANDLTMLAKDVADTIADVKGAMAN